MNNILLLQAFHPGAPSLRFPLLGVALMIILLFKIKKLTFALLCGVRKELRIETNSIKLVLIYILIMSNLIREFALDAPFLVMTWG